MTASAEKTKTAKTAVGYVGLGIMGAPCARNLLAAGFAVHVFARRSEAADPLVAAGATRHPDLSSLARACEIVVTNVTDTADVLQIVLGADGIGRSLPPGAIVIDMSTIAPAGARKIATALAANKIAFLDSPVSGGQKGAIDASLTFMVGGDADAFARARPVYEAMGKTVTRIGEAGAGQIAKACNQVIIGATIAAVADSFRLARANGVDFARVREALAGGFAASKVLELHAARMLADDFTPGFKAKLHQKDIRIAQQAATESGASLDSARPFADKLLALIEAGGGDLDSAAVFRIDK